MNRRITTPKLLAALALPTIVLAAPAATPLPLKAGLWETTITTTMSGMMMPEATLQNMKPEQRAQMEQMMKQMAARGPRTQTARSCVTAAELKDGLFKAARDNDNRNCRYDVVGASAKRQEMKMTCGGDMPMDGRMVLEVVDSGNTTGNMEMKSARGGMTMSFKSRWLRASCTEADED